MRRRCFQVLLVLAFMGSLAACSMAPKVSDDLTPAVYDFAQRLRWNDYSGASRYFDTEENRQEFLQTFTGMQDLQITDVVVESIDFAEDRRSASTSMVLEYFLLPSPVVKTYRFSLQWAYLGLKPNSSESWLVSSRFPSFP